MYTKRKCGTADDLQFKFAVDLCNSNMKEILRRYDAYIKNYIDEEVERRVNEVL